MRILYDTYPAAFDCVGGGEVQLLRSTDAIERAGHKVLLFDLWHPQFDDVDVVHYFSVQGGSMGFCDYVVKRGLPLAISPVLWLTAATVPALPMAEIRDLLHLAHVVMPNSQSEADQLCRRFGISSSKCVVAHNGVDASFAEPVPPELFRERFNLRKSFLLNAANIEKRKNQHRLIRALKGQGLDLVILGRVRDTDYFERCMQEGAGFVHYLGHVAPGSDLLRSAYAACEALVLPSLAETPGLVCLEAAAAGARVMVTEVGSAKEYFGNLVEYANPLDEDHIRSAVQAVLARQRNNALRDHVVSNFTWDRTAAQLIQGYNLAIETGRTGL